MKRVVVWGLAILALVVAALAGLLAFSTPARLVATIIVAEISRSGPPPLAKGVITGEDWPHFAAASKKLTVFLQTKFPVGSSEDVLKSTLLDQGFRPPDPVPSNCIPRGQQQLIGAVFYQCPTPEQNEQSKRTLVYKWGGGVCMQSISVEWSSDEHGALTRVEGGYYGACL
jgi:hypothetical protein